MQPLVISGLNRGEDMRNARTIKLKELESRLAACRANVAEKQEFIEALLTKNELIERENAELKRQIATWITLWENNRIGRA
jgi:hypothetical protein